MNDPGNPGVVYASAKDIYRSTDNGATWSSWTAPFNFDLNALGNPGETPMRINIAVSPFGPERYLYAWVNLRTPNPNPANGPSYNRYRMVRFNHASQAWDTPGAVYAANQNSGVGGAPVWMGLAASPTVSGHVAYSGSKPLLSLSHGVAQVRIGKRSTIHDDVHIMRFSPDGTELWVGHDGGLSMTNQVTSQTENTIWLSKNNGLAVGTVFRIASSPVDPVEILIGNQDEGDTRRHESAGPGAPWSIVQAGDGGSVAYSTDGTKAWTQSYNARNNYTKWFQGFSSYHDFSYIPGCCDTCNCPDECWDPTGICGAWGASMFPPFVAYPEGNRFTLGIADAWMENDQEAISNTNADFTRLTQVQADMDIITGESGWFLNNCVGQGQERLVIAPSDPAKIYLATSGIPDANCSPNGSRPILMRSLPNGSGQLPPLGSGQPRFEESPMPAAWLADMKYIRGLDLDPNDPDHIFVAFSGYNPDLKVYESFDRGSTWVNADPNATLPNLPVNDLVFQQGTDGGVYIAMDIGVYYRNAVTDWQPFCAGLPNVQVTDLEINYCAGKLRAGTWGRGLWESDLAEQPTLAREITTNTTWSIHKNLAQDVRVMPGATLTITSTANFAPNTALIIEPGASVIVDGGLLHNSCGLGWKGVQVLGNSAMAQTPANQGFLELRNGGRIEKGDIGILVGDLDDLSKGGGIVKIVGTQAQPGGIVRDCRPAVQYRPYGYTPNSGYYLRNVSRFVHAVFEFTNAAVDAEQGMEELIKLDGVDGIGFYACAFRNTIADVPETHLLGHGIHSMESRFRVTSACPNPGSPCPASEIVHSTFSGLDHAVHALGAAVSSIFSVEWSDFANNICGVYASGITGFRVRNNDFELTDRAITYVGPEDIEFDSKPRGIYTYESFGFKIHDNTAHSPTLGTLVAAEAIVVGYSRDHNDKIWKNIARDLSDGFIGEGIAASTEPGGYSGTIGLQLLCNNCGNVDRNLYSRKIENQDDQELHTIRTIQASAGRGADNTLDGWAGEAEKWDFYKDTDPAITYYFRTGTGLFPEHVSDQVLANGIPFGMSSECTPHLISVDPGTVGVAGMLLQAKTDYGETRYLYEELIDGGNTDAVVQEIVSSWPQDVWDLRDFLLAHSPYLSVEALKELIDKPAVPEAIKAEVCIANPEATRQEGFIKWAELDALYPLPPHLIASIVASWDTHTYRSTLEAQMGERHAQMTEAANELIDLYATKDSAGSHNDSLRWVWQQLPTVAARYAEALLRMQEGEYATAQALMDDLDEDHKLSTAEETERTRMGTLISDLLNLEQQGRDVRELNAGEIATWETLIQDQYDRPATWISNILCFHYGICRSPLTGGDSEPKRLQLDAKDAASTDGRTFKLQPNPASTFVTLNYTLKPGEATGSVRVLDSNGRTLATEALKGNIGQVVLDTRTWAKGVYAAQCSVGGAIVHAERLVIQ